MRSLFGRFSSTLLRPAMESRMYLNPGSPSLFIDCAAEINHSRMILRRLFTIEKRDMHTTTVLSVNTITKDRKRIASVWGDRRILGAASSWMALRSYQTRSPFKRPKGFRWILHICLVVSGCIFLYYSISERSHLAAASKSPTDVVLLACGSFNPPTIMHLRMFELARDHLRRNTEYNPVRGVISPVHHGYGKPGLESSAHRLAMLKLATDTSEWIRVDDWEVMQLQYCRTIVVLRHMKSVHKERVMLLCGADLLKSFGVPGVWRPEDMEEILREYGIIVITRSGTDLQNVIEQIDVLSRHKDNIYIVTEKMTNEISSTKIRDALRNGESVRYLVPDSTLEYIYANNLYGSSKAL